MLQFCPISECLNKTLKEFLIDGHVMYLVWTDGTYSSFVSTQSGIQDRPVYDSRGRIGLYHDLSTLIKLGVTTQEEYDKKAEEIENEQMNSIKKTELSVLKRLLTSYPTEAKEILGDTLL